MEKRTLRVLMGLLALLFCASQALAAPLAPASITLPASPDADGIYRVKWAAVTGCSYVLEEDTGSGFAVLYSGSRTYIDLTRAQGSSSSFQVKAVNASGSSPYRVGAYAVTVGAVVTPWGAPTKLLVPATGGATIKITFGGAPLGSTYVLEKQVDGGAFTAVYTGTNTYYYDSGLVTTSTYNYRVKATKANYPDSSYYPNATGSSVVVVLPSGPAPCLACHDGATATSATAWSTGGHANGDVLPTAGSGGCDSCHNVAPAPGATVAQVTCQGCHGVGAVPHAAGAYTTGVELNLCNKCHKVYNADGSVTATSHQNTINDTHFDDPATTVAPAGGSVIEGYVIRKNGTTLCSDCHGHQAKAAAHTDWSNSAHGGHIASGPVTDATGVAWAHYNWDQTTSRGTCQRCHTATGISNFLTNPATYDATGNGNNFSHLSGWTAATGSGQNELLYCWGCHSDVESGALRNPGAITNTYAGSPAGSPAVVVAYPNVDKSNVCMGCHLGVEVGEVVQTSLGDFTNLSFINSHYMAAGGMVFNESGYEYAGQTYDNLGFHKQVGVANTYATGTEGPCVTCHMTSANPHEFAVVIKDGAGVISGVASTECVKCHGGLTASVLNISKTEFNTALAALNTALAAKGIYYNSAYPYFFKDPDGNGFDPLTEAIFANAFKNWDAVYPGKGKDVMGAAFNYNLIGHDPGAYAHNRDYALKLIQDSIDFLADGTVDGLGTSAAVSGVMSSESFDGSTTWTATGHPSDSMGGDASCVLCHTSNVSESAVHALSGVPTVSNVAFVTSGANLVLSYNLQIDGVDAIGFTTVNRDYRLDSATGNRLDLGAVTTATDEGGGDYSVILPGAAANANSRYLLRVTNAAGVVRALIVGDYPASPVTNLVSDTACTDCHGNQTTGFHYSYPVAAKQCVVCHDAANTTYPRLYKLGHGIHNSHNMASGHYELDAENVFSVTFPTYMNNCSNCHREPAQLAAVNAEPVSYDFCFSCHGGWTAWNHGDTSFGVTNVEHSGFTAATNCATCHNGTTAGDTITDFHNGRQTERSGVIWNGQDQSIIEGAKVDMQITGVSRSGANLLVNWTTKYNNSTVDPCNAVATLGLPAFFAAAANTATGQVAGGFSILRAYAQGDDFINPGIGTSPGQPVSTTLTTTNTVCAGGVATSTIALSAAEQAMTRGRVAIQGKAQVNLAAALGITDYDPATAGNQTVDQVRSKSPTREFVVANGNLPAEVRRDIVDTASCLKCHPGSLYQHGGNRVDNVDLCVMCHNEASSEQSVRVFDGVDSTEAYDGKPGMTYGFKSLLHAVHSAGINGAITMCYRTNGNYVWAGETTVIPNYPTVDVFNAPLVSGMAAIIYGSSAPHGTGPVIDGPLNSVYRVHNLHNTTYPQVLNNCVSCHVPGTFGVPDATVSMATTVDVGGVLGNQTTSSGAVYGTQTDDVLRGTASAACMSCHQSADAVFQKPLQDHANSKGFIPTALPGGRADVIGGAVTESCDNCH